MTTSTLVKSLAVALTATSIYGAAAVPAIVTTAITTLGSLPRTSFQPWVVDDLISFPELRISR